MSTHSATRGTVRSIWEASKSRSVVRAASSRWSQAGKPATTNAPVLSRDDWLLDASIKVGTTITFVNDDDEHAHNIVSGTRTAPTQDFSSGLLEPGQRWHYTFTTPDVYPYFCSIHLGMDGVIIVE